MIYFTFSHLKYAISYKNFRVSACKVFFSFDIFFHALNKILFKIVWIKIKYKDRHL